jgi:predicted ATPase
MNHDRITQLRIGGMRCIEWISLDLRGLAVLIGDNGSGKSTVLEALELLHQAAKPVNFINDILYRGHGGLQSLLRHGSKELILGVTVEGAGPKLEYAFKIAEVGTSPEIVGELLAVLPNKDADLVQVLIDRNIINRDGRNVRFQHGTKPEVIEKQIDPRTLALRLQGLDVQPEVERLAKALDAIEIHAPFETRPIWQQQELDTRYGPRKPTVVESSQSLARYGVNLSNCYQHLRNLGDEVWTRVRDRIRLGLGDDFRDFRLPSPNPGHIALEIIYGSSPGKPVPIDSLSEGQISYLAFVALAELNDSRSVLAYDEPELHLHPALLARVVGMLEEVAESCPVILATHSDRLLDALTDPAQSVVLCELDGAHRTQLQRPNPVRLAEWLGTYRGLGAIRAEGYEAHVFDGGSAIGSPEKGR